METEGQTCRILQLSDCTMMYILSYLDATSLFNLSRTCLYFNNITLDPKLWRYIEARREPNDTIKVQYVCERVHEKTTHLFLRAESKFEGLLNENILLSWNSLEYLSVLALENQRFDGKKLSLLNFPKTLIELSLKKTHVKRGKSFFQGSYHTMRNLRVLILDQCDWVDSNFFMSIAKYENLEILSIIKCMRLHINVIPYLSVARHGCKKLRLIDCRFNTVSNEILKTFDSRKRLLALYFQSMRSYELDTGTPFMKCPPLKNNFHELIEQSIIKNRSLEPFKYSVGCLVEELPQSVLYDDPYPECTCGYKDRTDDEPCLQSNEPTESKSETASCSMPIDDYIDFHLSPQKFICKKHFKELGNLPIDFKNFFYENQKKFFPGSSDDSDSDDEDCCMFGAGKSQQMIVLKVREVDEQGNLPQPHFINLNPSRDYVNVDIEINGGAAIPRRSGFNRLDPQPSTSRQNSDNPSRESVRKTEKRKVEEESSGEDNKKARMEEPERRLDPQPSTSRHNFDNHSGESVPKTEKKKLKRESSGDDNKKAKIGEAGRSGYQEFTFEVKTSYKYTLSNGKEETKNMSGSENNKETDNSRLDPQPSTSRENFDNPSGESVRKTTKKKEEGEVSEEDNKKDPGELGSRDNPIPVHIMGPPTISYSRRDFSMARIDRSRPNDPIRVLHIPMDAVVRNQNKIKKNNLRRLSLRGYREVTDEALYNIRSLNLDLLDVTYTGVTREGIEKFLTLNPNCRIIHVDYCKCKPKIPC